MSREEEVRGNRWTQPQLKKLAELVEKHGKLIEEMAYLPQSWGFIAYEMNQAFPDMPRRTWNGCIQAHRKYTERRYDKEENVEGEPSLDFSRLEEITSDILTRTGVLDNRALTALDRAQEILEAIRDLHKAVEANTSAQHMILEHLTRPAEDPEGEGV